MVGRGKTFELLDFAKFAVPSLLKIDPAETASNLVDRLGGKSFMSYAQVYGFMSAIVSGYGEKHIAGLGPYAEDWKNNAIREAAQLLARHFGGRGRWYPMGAKPLYVLGFWFKPSIKGVWHVDGQSYAVLINARKGQRLTEDHYRFCGRGVYELHCVDDPADPIPLIVDLSEPKIGEGRKLRVREVQPSEAITLDEFDAILREFVKALELAGVAVPDHSDATSMVSLFKKK